jgi:hypothetical protein
MADLALIGSVLLPWVLGIAFLWGTRTRIPAAGAGEICWTLGAGWFASVLFVALWMHLLSAIGVKFGVGTIGAPLLLAAAIAIAWQARRARPDRKGAVSAAWRDLRASDLTAWSRALWIGLLAWLALRGALALAEIVMRPMFPWEGWSRWATKARVFFELRSIVPFVGPDQWLASSGGVWFDAGPREPLTIPLLLAWESIAMGRWDDALMNVSWWVSAVALSLAVFGALRTLGVAPVIALLATWLVASLPLIDVHVALAGYADVFLSAFFALAGLALLRWQQTHAAEDVALAALFVIACPLVKSAGTVWIAAAIPGMIAALAPARGQRVATIVLAVGAGGLLLLSRTHLTVAGVPLHIEFAPAWASFGADLFFLDNWHLLWYAVIVVAVLGWRHALKPPLAPLTFMLAGGVLCVFAVFAFPGITSRLGDATNANRAALVIAPLVCVWIVLTFRAWASAWRDSRSAAAVAAAA